jgi:uncharacterized protein YraI
MLAGTTLLAFSAIVHAQNAYTNRDANLRAGPDRSYPLVVRLGAGAPVNVMGCLDDWSWCDVASDDARGWVYSPSLSYVYQGERVPFYSYAPSFGLPVITFSLGTYWDQYYRGRPWFAQREQWEHRTIPHRRPSGPPPRDSHPPLHAQGPGPRPEAGARSHGGSAIPEREGRPQSGARENEARPSTGREVTPRREGPSPRGAPAAHGERSGSAGRGGEAGRAPAQGRTGEQSRGGEHPQKNEHDDQRKDEGHGDQPR